MAKVLLIVGAGASVMSGLPVLANFFDFMFRQIESAKVHGLRDDVLEFRRAHDLLASVTPNADIDLFNLESVWTAMEMGKQLHDSDRSSPFGMMDSAMQAMVRLIQYCVSSGMDFRWMMRPAANGTAKSYHPVSAKYLKFVNMLENYCQGEYSIVTFNYDLGFDSAYAYKGIPVNYFLHGDRARDARQFNSVPLIKLHGSANWAASTDGDSPFPVSIPVQAKDSSVVAKEQDPLVAAPAWKTISVAGTQVAAPSWLAHELRDVIKAAYMVPPTENKGVYRSAIKSVWKHASECIRTAEVIVFVGYSVPATDQFFRNLFALSSINCSVFRRVIVIDPSPLAYDRIKDILSRNAQRRATFYRSTLLKCLDDEHKLWKQVAR